MKKNITKINHRIFVPLTSFYLYDMGINSEGPARIIDSWSIPNTDIKLLKFSKRVGISGSSDNPTFDSEVFINEIPFETKTIFPCHSNHLSFNSGFLFEFTPEDSDSLMVMPHRFEDKIRNPLTLLRLFCPGNLFAPYGFLEGKDIMSFHDFHQNLNDGHSALHVSGVPDFLRFYEKYSILAENLRQKSLEIPGSVYENWYKRINNGIYFFSQIYFTSERNQINPNARDKNNLRLIYLCTALDALIGNGNPNGRKLAEKADLILPNVIGVIKKDIENFYDERSRYIHANPNTMRGPTSNKTIEIFCVYIQKIIFVSLELFGNNAFIEALTDSKEKHWFSFYEKSRLYNQYMIKEITRKAFEEVSKNNDGYELANSDFIK